MAPTTNPKLQQLESVIESILAEAGVPGVAIGVVHENTVIHQAYHDLRDVSAVCQ
jgi:hypothetical protein